MPSADKVKASCSEMLGLYGLLRYFFELHIGDHAAVRVEFRSFLAACKVLDLVLLAKRCTADVAAVAAQLQIATAEHLRLSGNRHGHHLQSFHWKFQSRPWWW